MKKTDFNFTTLKGWEGIQDFEGFEKLWIDMSHQLKPNYTVCADLRLMPIFSRNVEDLFSRIQRYTMQNGLLKMAEVVAMNDISDLQFHRMSSKNDMPTDKFKTVEEADKHLDELIEAIEDS